MMKELPNEGINTSFNRNSMESKVIIDQGNITTIKTDGTVQNIKIEFNSNTTVKNLEITFFQP